MSDFYLVPLLPEIFLTMIAIGLLIVGAGRGNESTSVVSWAALMGMVFAFFLLLGLKWSGQTVLNGMFAFDQFTGFIKVSILLGSMISLALSVQYLHQESMARFEYPILMLFATVGMMLMVSAHNMLALYVGLELQALSLYVLATFQRNSSKSSEAGLKYFVLGALSSGLLLFGISLIYGFVGSIDYNIIAITLQTGGAVPMGVTFGLVFILAAIAFKLSAAPFHMWTPDVYEGAPTSVTAFFAIVPKFAAIAMLIRLLFGPFAATFDQWSQIIYFLSVASMLVGAFAAIVQENIKRLLAYSSIGHIGYALIGLVVALPGGAGATLLYLLIYMVMNAGAFAIVLSMRRGGVEVKRVSDLSGLSKTQPFLAYAMAILMFSMCGLPPMAGFFGKLMVFDVALENGYYLLTIIGVLTSVVAAYYYLRIVKVMFFDDAKEPFDLDIGYAKPIAICLSILFVVGFIFKPNIMILNSMSAASVLFSG